MYLKRIGNSLQRVIARVIGRDYSLFSIVKLMPIKFPHDDHREKSRDKDHQLFLVEEGVTLRKSICFQLAMLY